MSDNKWESRKEARALLGNRTTIDPKEKKVGLFVTGPLSRLEEVDGNPQPELESAAMQAREYVQENKK